MFNNWNNKCNHAIDVWSPFNSTIIHTRRTIKEIGIILHKFWSVWSIRSLGNNDQIYQINLVYKICYPICWSVFSVLVFSGSVSVFTSSVFDHRFFYTPLIEHFHLSSKQLSEIRTSSYHLGVLRYLWGDVFSATSTFARVVGRLADLLQYSKIMTICPLILPQADIYDTKPPIW
jgi:hypothetical protein